LIDRLNSHTGKVHTAASAQSVVRFASHLVLCRTNESIGYLPVDQMDFQTRSNWNRTESNPRAYIRLVTV